MDILAPLGEPFSEAIYTEISAVRAALEDHARTNGYAIGVKSSKAQRFLYRCSKGGKYDSRFKDPEVHESKRRRNTSTTKTGCKFMVEARKEAEGWKTKVLINEHNHGPVAALSALPQYRIAAMTPEERLHVKTMHTLGYSPGQILNTLRHGNPENVLIPKDIYNILATLRMEELGGQTPIQWLLKVCFCLCFCK
jgi:FAR1 DNA-binding domain